MRIKRKRSAQALGWAEGLRMEARRAKTWRSRGLVHDSRTPMGSSPKQKQYESTITLRDREIAKGLAKQALHHRRSKALEKVLLTTDLEPHRVDVSDSRPMTQSA